MLFRMSSQVVQYVLTFVLQGSKNPRNGVFCFFETSPPQTTSFTFITPIVQHFLEVLHKTGAQEILTKIINYKGKSSLGNTETKEPLYILNTFISL